MPRRDEARERDGPVAGTRASAVTVGIVFLGLAIVTALLAGSFWVVATEGGEAGDPAAVGLSASRCTVSATDGTTGIGTVTASVRYTGNGSVDLSDATVRYADETTAASLDVGAEASRTTARLVNDTGAFDASIVEGETLTLVVPIETVRGAPLESGMRASLELAVDGGTVDAASVRAPNGLSEDQSYVGC